jgi:hypothetical protein
MGYMSLAQSIAAILARNDEPDGSSANLPNRPALVYFQIGWFPSLEQTGLPDIRPIESLRSVLMSWEYSRQTANYPKTTVVVSNEGAEVEADSRPTVTGIVDP